MTTFVLTFSLLFAASIALYCSIAYALFMRQRKLERKINNLKAVEPTESTEDIPQLN